MSALVEEGAEGVFAEQPGDFRVAAKEPATRADRASMLLHEASPRQVTGAFPIDQIAHRAPEASGHRAHRRTADVLRVEDQAILPELIVGDTHRRSPQIKSKTVPPITTPATVAPSTMIAVMILDLTSPPPRGAGAVRGWRRPPGV